MTNGTKITKPGIQKQEMIMIETFEIIHGFYHPETVCSLFKLKESAGTRRHPSKLCKMAVCTNQYALLKYFLLTVTL